MKNFLKNWKLHLNSPIRIINFIFTFLLLVLILMFYSEFLLYIEMRSGFAFTDPLLSLFEPVDYTYLLFSLMYGMILVVLVIQLFEPQKFIILIRAYVFLLIFRALGMMFLPLEAPVTMIILKDPLIEYFGTGQTLTKDLFFSGHTATSFLLYFSIEKKYIKFILLIAAFIVAILVLVQHVHYTIDVIAAPFFAYAAFQMSVYINKIY